MRHLLLTAFLTASLGAQETPRQATEARLWLRVPAGQAPLRDLEVSAGSAMPAPWEKDPAARERLTEIIFPVRWWDWRSISISFISPADGSVELVLTGPWEEEKPGQVFRKEVLWDGITAEGTELGNGSFEIQTNGRPDAWTAGGRDYPTPSEWPLSGAEALQGSRLASASQDRPLGQTLQVSANRKVTLQLHAKAATLPGFTAPKRLGRDTPAHRALAQIKRGMNLGNCWEAPPPYTWGIRYTVEDIDRIAAEGFDHVRVPVAWTHHLKPVAAGWEISPTLLADLEPVLRRALEKKLHVLLDWHHFDELTDAPAAQRARFVSSWETIARHFKDWPAGLFLELLNEPRDALTTEAANPIYAEAIAAIRRIDPQRILLVSPGNWGDIRELDKLQLPDGDERLVVTVHCYEPFYFTHQGAPWVNLHDLRGIVYPGPPASPLAVPERHRENAGIRDFIARYNSLPTGQNPCSAAAVRDLLDYAKAWAEHFGRPIHLGEFGSHDIGDQPSRSRYSEEVRSMAEARGIPWTLWDWKATFGYWDSQKNKPRFPREALLD